MSFYDQPIESLRGARRIQLDTDEFCRLLDSSPSEEIVHSFLVQRRWILEPLGLKHQHSEVYSKPRLGAEYVPDIVIRNSWTGGNYYSFVELERPSLQLITKSGRPTAQLTHAIQQCSEWRQWLRTNAFYASGQFPEIDLGEVHFVILAGRRRDLSPKNQRAFRASSETLSNLEVMTYDRLLDYAKRLVASLEEKGLIIHSDLALESYGPDKVSTYIVGLKNGDTESLPTPLGLDDLYAQRAYDRWNAAFHFGNRSWFSVEDKKSALKLLRDSDSDVRWAALRALGVMAKQHMLSIELIIPFLTDKSWRVRCEAATAIRCFGREAVPHLIGLLTDGDCSVQRSAVVSLGSIGPDAHDGAIPLSDLLIHDNHCVRLYAIQALSKIGPGAYAAVEKVLALAGSSSGFEQGCALYALGEFAAVSLQAVEGLCRLTMFAGENRKYAVKQLGKVAPEFNFIAVATLVELLNDADVQNEACEALGQLGPRAESAVAALCRFISDQQTTTFMRRAAIETIGHIGPAARAAEPILRYFLKDDDWRHFAERALAEVAPMPNSSK